MNKNITLKLNASILQKVKYMAIEKHKSVSQWVADLITQNVVQKEDYQAARKRALKRLHKGFHLGGKPLTRDEIYDRL